MHPVDYVSHAQPTITNSLLSYRQRLQLQPSYEYQHFDIYPLMCSHTFISKCASLLLSWLHLLKMLSWTLTHNDASVIVVLWIYPFNLRGTRWLQKVSISLLYLSHHNLNTSWSISPHIFNIDPIPWILKTLANG